MTENELQSCMDRIGGLWPGMKMTVALTEVWRVMLRPHQYEAVYAAIDEHWASGEEKFAPDQRKVRELIRVHTREYQSPEDAKTAARYRAMSDVNKARADRDWHELRARQETDEAKRQYHERVAKVAADKAARLFRLEQRREPVRIPTVEELQKIYRCKIRRETE